MAAPGRVRVDIAKLREAFDFVSSGAEFDHVAYVHLDSGRVFCRSDLDAEEDADQPSDLETSDRYIPLPSAGDLGLGRRLALRFVEQEIPSEYATVAAYFRRQGAYRRFKELLNRHNALQRWYIFDTQAVDEALRQWCDEVGLEPVEKDK
ncbi:UPF0158 family protein [Paracraurococcus ruber]|uniref:Uncharacterized protein n=1 Tax=Paracraurococcus ruber TaxID=77675 RepID=A0ABS1D5E2_9PROT|nr:UPF0158 family protein [Paracraurococcus ruber]MBK1662082.1 hypothetical protein [Paracraurococcus ruber]TDG16163.1 hypothetical protein E2C05_29645 [Paracraurococcus ruber]